VAALATACAGLAHAVPPEGFGPLPWRIGGRIGFTVDAAAFPDSAGHTLDVYVRIPPATLAGLVADSMGIRKLRVAATLRSRYGARSADASRELSLAPEDTASGFGRVVLLRFPTKPGPQKLQVVLSDMLSRRRGLMYMGRKIPEGADVDGEFQLLVPKSGPELSDLEFVWTEAPSDLPAGSTAFHHAERIVLPNPERLYGLYATDLRAFFTVRGAPEDARPWHWSARMRDDSDVVVAERESTSAAAPSLSATVTLDLSKHPAGGYDLEITAWHEGEAARASRRERFSIAWQPEYWFRNPRDIEDGVHLLLNPEEEDAFSLMQPGEQERFLDHFWAVRDPSPGSAVNEARVMFLQRVAEANRLYSRAALGQGMFSDMGRVYIRYGEPTEVFRQVIPAGDQTLEQAVAALGVSEDRPVGDVKQKGPGGDQRPFEIWVYDGFLPPPPETDPTSYRIVHKRLVFLFVDEQGLGSYNLRYSTE